MQGRRANGGFTLLEVIIAMTITSLVMGGLFAVSAGSKQLALRSQDALYEAVETRASIQFALLDDEYRDIEPILATDRYRIEGGDVIPDSPRRTAPTQHLLQRYELHDQDSNETLTGSRWVRFDLPR